MAVGRTGGRPRVRAGRGRGEGQGRGMGRGIGGGDSGYDSGYNTPSQSSHQAFQAKRQQLQDLNGGVAPVQGLACNCGTPAASRTVRKDGPNKGRDFFCCPKPQGEQCGFFKFADEVVGGGNQGGGGVGAAFGGGAGFGGGTRGQARGRGRGEKRMREALGGDAGQGEKKQRKCGLCHQPGHTRNRFVLAFNCSEVQSMLTIYTQSFHQP